MGDRDRQTPRSLGASKSALCGRVPGPRETLSQTVVDSNYTPHTLNIVLGPPNIHYMLTCAHTERRLVYTHAHKRKIKACV